MRTITEFPVTVTEKMDLAIHLPDGTRLSARSWIPDDAISNPVPAILEYLPYRKSDGTIIRDQLMHPYLAGHGYACIRVDRRGCGDSEGYFDDEYSEQELSDGVDIIHWIAAQPWCDGSVAMQGISWGGFNALQIAARAPKPLGAVITIGSTVDRFADDIHYKGGIQLTENIGWAATAMSWNASAPDPDVVGKEWRTMWLDRLNTAPFLGAIWQEHPTRDDYWRHGSVCEEYNAIKCPVLALGGLHDGYRNTMTHLVQNLSVPVKAIAGPWNHKYPFMSGIGPSIGFLQEALRWYDHWLKGIDTEVNGDPAYRAYLMDSIEPAATLTHRPGQWIAEPTWPSHRIKSTRFDFGNGTLGRQEDFEIKTPVDLACGEACGEYFPFGFGAGELPDNQQVDDTRSSCFDSKVLSDGIDIVGAPTVSLRVASDRPQAQVIVRLTDLRPDGSSAFISHGMLNLRQRNGHDKMEPLIVGQEFDIAITLDQTAYRLPAGHRLRVAVSSSYWPFLWPERKTAVLTLSAGQLGIPIRPSTVTDGWKFQKPEVAPARKMNDLRPTKESKSRTTDPITGLTTLTIEADLGKTEDIVSGLITESYRREDWSIGNEDPNSASARILWTRGMTRGDWSTSTWLLTEMHGDDHIYYVTQHIKAFEGTAVVFDKLYSAEVPRK